jgi:hypothetical protein
MPNFSRKNLWKKPKRTDLAIPQLLKAEVVDGGDVRVNEPAHLLFEDS